MRGFRAPFVPGWDCHGLPIEFKVVKESRGLAPASKCGRRAEAYARKYIDIQRGQFKRLGVLGDLGESVSHARSPGTRRTSSAPSRSFVEKGLVYQSKKPVLLEHRRADRAGRGGGGIRGQRIDPAIYREVSRSSSGANSRAKASMVIWTTTPWTLPANVAIAVHPESNTCVGEYAGARGRRRTYIVVASRCSRSLQSKTGCKLANELADAQGRPSSPASKRSIRSSTARRRSSPRDFVTLDTGTGQVHVAPGHGADDYIAGRENGLPILSPVDDRGRFTDEVGVPESRRASTSSKRTRASSSSCGKRARCSREQDYHAQLSALLALEDADHLPRGRAVLHQDRRAPRERARGDRRRRRGCPHWGRNRIYGTVESRPDWCISRQRTWGVPLPVFYDADGGADPRCGPRAQGRRPRREARHECVVREERR